MSHLLLLFFSTMKICRQNTNSRYLTASVFAFSLIENYSKFTDSVNYEFILLADVDKLSMKWESLQHWAMPQSCSKTSSVQEWTMAALHRSAVIPKGWNLGCFELRASGMENLAVSLTASVLFGASTGEVPEYNPKEPARDLSLHLP